MKKLIIALIVPVLLCCCDGTGNSKVGSMTLSEMKVDTVCYLTGSKQGPKLEISLRLLYFPGKQGMKLNRELFKPLLITQKHVDNMQEAVSGFVNDYIHAFREANRYYDADPTEDYSMSYRERMRCERNGEVLNLISNSWIKNGGTEEEELTSVVNLNRNTGKVIKLEDVLVPGYQSELLRVIINKLAADCHTKGLEGLREQGIFNNQEPYISDNFQLKKNQINFIYNDSEIAPKEKGIIIVKVKKSDIKILCRN